MTPTEPGMAGRIDCPGRSATDRAARARRWAAAAAAGARGVWPPGTPARSRRRPCASRSPSQPFPGGDGAALRGAGIVEDGADRRGQPRHVARRARHPGLAVDHGLAQTADVGRHQRGAGRGGLERDDAERLVVAGQHCGVGACSSASNSSWSRRPTNRVALSTLCFRACSTSQSCWVPSPAMVSVVPGWARLIRGARRSRRARPSRIPAARGRAVRRAGARAGGGRTASAPRRFRCG